MTASAADAVQRRAAMDRVPVVRALPAAAGVTKIAGRAPALPAVAVAHGATEIAGRDQAAAVPADQARQEAIFAVMIAALGADAWNTANPRCRCRK